MTKCRVEEMNTYSQITVLCDCNVISPKVHIRISPESDLGKEDIKCMKYVTLVYDCLLYLCKIWTRDDYTNRYVLESKFIMM